MTFYGDCIPAESSKLGDTGVGGRQVFDQIKMQWDWNE